MNELSPEFGGLLSGEAAAGGNIEFGNGFSDEFLDLSSGSLTDETVLPNLSLTQGALTDWFTFTINQAGEEGQFASVTFDQNQSHLQIALYASNIVTNSSATPIEQGTTDGDVSQVNLQGLAPGTYYLEVSGNNPIAAYDLAVDATIAPPTQTQAPDWSQPNSQSAPYDLRTITGSQVFTGLSIDPSSTGNSSVPDWFKFQTTAVGQDGDYVEISFDTSAGDLDLASPTQILRRPARSRSRTRRTTASRSRCSTCPRANTTSRSTATKAPRMPTTS